MAGAIGKSESLVIPGFEFTFPDGKFGGRMVIAFPGSTSAQAKDYADQINTAISIKHYRQEQTRTTTCFSMCFRGAESDLDDEDKVMYMPTGISITNTLQYVEMIRDKFTERNYPERNYPERNYPESNYPGHNDPEHNYPEHNYLEHYPDISLVNLLRFISPDEALTVRTVDGQVHYKNFASNSDLDDTSHFFRVGFFLNPTDRVIIWISLSNFLPISVVNPTGERVELYAVPPSIPDTPNPPPAPVPSDLFHWLPPVLNNPTMYPSILFRQSGTDSRAVIYPNGNTVDTRVSKENTQSGDPAAIIANSELEFSVYHVHTYIDSQ